MKKIRRNSLFCIIITLLILVFILKDNYRETIYWLLHANKFYLLIAIAFYMISFSFDTYSFYLIINQYAEYSFLKTFKLNLMTKFFNGITPLASGGQPLQLYELHKDNIKITDATNMITQFFIVYQIALVFFSIVTIVISNYLSFEINNIIVRKMILLGFIINIVILIIVIIVSFNKKINRKVISSIVKILYKFKIIKNKDSLIKKINSSCDRFYQNSQVLLKNSKTFIICVLLQIVQLIFLFIIPFFVFKSITDVKTLNILNTIVISCYIHLASYYIPIPGATGGMEYGFISLFSTFVNNFFLKTATILWRFITYFLPVIVGGIMFNIKSKHKNK